MRKFFIVTCLALLLNVSSVIAAEVATPEGPDPSKFWGTLIFGPDQLGMEGEVPDLLIIHLVGQNAGWIMKQVDDVYKVTFLSAIPMPNLILTRAEYDLFKAIHITLPSLRDEFILIPSSQQVSASYDEIMLNIDNFSNLQIKSGEGLFVGLYSLQVTRDVVEIPLVYLDQAGYDQLLSEMDRVGPLLRFDKLE